MRTHSSQLPSYEELTNILAAERQREIPKENFEKHFGDVTTIVTLLEVYKLPTSFFSETITFEDLKDEEFFEELSSTLDRLITAILVSQDDENKQELFDDLYDYLAEEDQPEQADIIFVNGSKATSRIETAIELYKKGFASTILISGRCPFFELETNTVSEAEILAEYAVEQGIPSEALLLEKESITLPDNVKRSLNLLEEKNIPYEKIILVNQPFGQRRGWVHFKKMSPLGTQLFRVNVRNVSERFSRDGWYRDETGTKIIVKEFFGLQVSNMINTG